MLLELVWVFSPASFMKQVLRDKSRSNTHYPEKKGFGIPEQGFVSHWRHASLRCFKSGIDDSCNARTMLLKQ